MRIIQLTSSDSGDHIGLYRTERTDNGIEEDIKRAFDLAINESEDSDDQSPYDIADEYLEKLGIERVFADEVFIDNI
jgi:hypothetical protein